MKFAKLLAEVAALQADAKWLNYKQLKKQLKPPTTAAGAATSFSIASTPEALAAHPHAVAFFSLLHREVEEIAAFFAKEEASLASKYESLVNEFKAHCLSHLGTSTEAGAESTLQLLRATTRLYTLMLQLENTCVFNVAGFTKALKKWDKLNGTSLKEPFMVTVVTKQPFAAYTRLNSMLAGCEDIFKLLLGMLPPSALQGKAPLAAEEAGKLRHLKEVQTSLSIQEQQQQQQGGMMPTGGGAVAAADEEEEEEEEDAAGKDRGRLVGVKSPRAGRGRGGGGGGGGGGAGRASSSVSQRQPPKRRKLLPEGEGAANGQYASLTAAVGASGASDGAAIGGGGGGDGEADAGSLMALAALVMTHDHHYHPPTTTIGGEETTDEGESSALTGSKGAGISMT